MCYIKLDVLMSASAEHREATKVNKNKAGYKKLHHSKKLHHLQSNTLTVQLMKYYSVFWLVLFSRSLVRWKHNAWSDNMHYCSVNTLPLRGLFARQSLWNTSSDVSASHQCSLSLSVISIFQNSHCLSIISVVQDSLSLSVSSMFQGQFQWREAWGGAAASHN